MPRRTSLAVRGCALALLLSPATGGFLAACGDDTVVLPADAGTGVDATATDAGGDATAEGSAEASCAVDAGPLDPAQVAAGHQLVGTHKCTNCHGDTLSGNNDGVPSLTVMGGTAYPPNLTPDPATGLGCWSNAQIENAILNGIDNQGMPLCSPMPVFGHIAGDAGLTPPQAAQVVAFLRSLSIVSNQVPDTPACPVPPPADAAVDAPPDGAVDSGHEGGPDAAPEAGPVDAGTEGGSDAAPEASAEAGEAGAEASAEAGEAGDDGGATDDGSVEAGD